MLPTKALPMIAADAHPGIWIGLMVDPAAGLPPDADHLTLISLPDAAPYTLQKTALIRALMAVADVTAPVQAVMGGMARFSRSPSSPDTEPVVLLVDSPELPSLYVRVLAAVQVDAALSITLHHGFLPHITFGFVEPDAPGPAIPMEREALAFSALTLVWAGERIDLPFGGMVTPDALIVAATATELLDDNAEDDKSPPELLYAPAGAIKMLDNGRLRVAGVVFGTRDLEGDQFTPATDFGFSRSPIGMPVYYDHAQRGVKSQIGTVVAWEAHDDRIEFEIELDRNRRYRSEIERLYTAKALGASSGAAGHLVVRDAGVLKRWIMAELSLTPTPMEPQTLPPLKAAPESAGDAEVCDLTPLAVRALLTAYRAPWTTTAPKE